MVESDLSKLDPRVVEFIETRNRIRAKIQTHAFTNGHAVPNPQFSVGDMNSRIKKLAVSYQLERKQESVLHELSCYIRANWQEHLLAYPPIATHLNILTIKEGVMDKDVSCIDGAVLSDLVNGVFDASSRLRRLSVELKPFMSTRGTVVTEVDFSANTYFQNQEIIAEVCRRVFEKHSLEDTLSNVPRSAGGVVAVAKYVSNVPHYTLRSAAFFNVLRAIKLPSGNFSKIRIGETIMSGIDGVHYNNYGTIIIP